jgi:poly-gamma-glutamate synthesis protein (capsule biosynthesis protein)
MKNRKHKNLPSLLLLLCLSFLLFLFSIYISKINNETDSLYFEATAGQNLPKKEKPITLIFVGDIMLDRGVGWTIQKYGQGDWKFPFLKISDYLQKADILFGNLEGPISDKGVRVGSIYSFRNDPKAIEGLTFAGFNVLSLANNHTLDYTRKALEDCLTRLSNIGIGYVGVGFTENEAFSPFIKKIEGTKIGFLAYTNLGPESWRATSENSGIAWLSEKDMEKIKEDIEAAKEKTDVLIVSLHTGEEYQKKPTQFQVEFSKMAIEAGADLVVGHHPHVVQEIEKYKEKYIAYSLGNFVFDQNFSEETMKGLILKVSIKDAKIDKVIPIKVKINGYFQPEIIK